MNTNRQYECVHEIARRLEGNLNAAADWDAFRRARPEAGRTYEHALAVIESTRSAAEAADALDTLVAVLAEFRGFERGRRP